MFVASGANVTFVGGSTSGNGTVGGLDGDGGQAASTVPYNTETNGSAYGDGVFLQGATATYNVSAGQTRTLTESIYGAGSDASTALHNAGTSFFDRISIDESSSAIAKTGPGVLQVATELRFGGTTVVNQGVLEVGTGGTLGSGSATVNAGGELRVDGSGVVNDFATTHDSATYTSYNTITVNGTASVPGVLTVTDTAAITNEPFIAVGSSGLGVFNLSGGTVSLRGGLTLGQAAASVGTFNVSAGTINGNQLIVGYNAGSGVVNQTGGTVTFNQLQLGQAGAGSYRLSGANSNLVVGSATGGYDAALGSNAGVAGTLVMSDGLFNVFNDLFVGLQGDGAVDQSGGLVVVQGNAELADGLGSTGHYLLSGTGQLATHSLIVGNAGTADFTQTGGKLTVKNTLTFDFPTGSTSQTRPTGRFTSAWAGRGRSPSRAGPSPPTCCRWPSTR